MSRGQAHPAEMRAQVLAALLTGQSVSQVARDFKLNRASVNAWRDQAGMGSSPVHPQKREDIGDLLIGYVRESLVTTTAQLAVFGNPVWLEKQSAAEVAVLHGVLVDKQVRLLEAFEQSSGESEPTEQPA